MKDLARIKLVPKNRTLFNNQGGLCADSLKEKFGIIITGSHKKRLSVLPYSPLIPRNGAVYSFHDIWPATYSSSNCFLYILLSPFHLVLLSLKNIPLPKSFFFHIYISNWHAHQNHQLTLNSINCATLRYGGILTSICI